MGIDYHARSAVYGPSRDRLSPRIAADSRLLFGIFEAAIDDLSARMQASGNATAGVPRLTSGDDLRAMLGEHDQAMRAPGDRDPAALIVGERVLLERACARPPAAHRRRDAIAMDRELTARRRAQLVVRG
jgi:hypothetical protein